MPYYVQRQDVDRILPGLLEGDFEALPRKFLDVFRTESSHGVFSLLRKKGRPKGASAPTRQVMNLLKAAGIVRVEFKYDGGLGRDASSFVAAATEFETLSREALAERLTGSTLLDPAFNPYAGHPEMSSESFRTFYSQRVSQMRPEQRLEEALSGLGMEACEILYGGISRRGEFIVSGRFSVNLQTQAVEDLVLDPPPNMRQLFIENFAGNWESPDS